MMIIKLPVDKLNKTGSIVLAMGLFLSNITKYCA